MDNSLCNPDVINFSVKIQFYQICHPQGTHHISPFSWGTNSKGTIERCGWIVMLKLWIGHTENEGISDLGKVSPWVVWSKTDTQLKQIWRLPRTNKLTTFVGSSWSIPSIVTTSRWSGAAVKFGYFLIPRYTLFYDTTVFQTVFYQTSWWG